MQHINLLLTVWSRSFYPWSFLYQLLRSQGLGRAGCWTTDALSFPDYIARTSGQQALPCSFLPASALAIGGPVAPTGKSEFFFMDSYTCSYICLYIIEVKQDICSASL